MTQKFIFFKKLLGVKYVHAADSSETVLLQKSEVFVGLITFILPLEIRW